MTLKLAAFLAAFLGPTVAAGQAPASASQEIENVAAFARLYGVVRYFYPSDAAAALDWNSFAVYGVSRVRGAPDRSALETTLRELFKPLGNGIEISSRLVARQQGGAPDTSLVVWRHFGAGFSALPGPYRRWRTHRAGNPAQTSQVFPDPVSGASVDVDLALGLRARVPLALSSAEAAMSPLTLKALNAALASQRDPAGSDAVEVRLADVVVAWNVFRHFYPYWPETQVDWDALLRPQLDAALKAVFTREAHHDALRALVAAARDGHGSVVDSSMPRRRGALPIQFRVMDHLLVVTASATQEVPVGSVVTSVEGVSASDWMARATRLSSGTDQWRSWRAARDLMICYQGTETRLSLEPPGAGARETRLSCNPTPPPTEPRPAAIAELEPGIWYVDLTRAKVAQLQPALPTLANAKGIVFDVRGYPTDAGSWILPYLLSAPDDDKWMFVARIIGPFGAIGGWEGYSWNVQPAAPHLPANRVVLTDGRAISYAESVMGFFRDDKLATIIGSSTAGTNGNVASFRVPGGFQITFTGMRVTRHDGHTPFHLVGVAPDISMEPSLAALRAGRDELLERALAVLRAPR